MTCKFEISGPHRLTCRAVRKLLQAFMRRHVPCAMCHQSTHDKHHRRSGVLARRMVPRRDRSDQPFGRYSRKCLDTHTDWLTDWPTNTSGQLFFTDPPVEIFVHRTFNAKAFERSFTTILDKSNNGIIPVGRRLKVMFLHRYSHPLTLIRNGHKCACDIAVSFRNSIEPTSSTIHSVKHLQMINTWRDAIMTC